MIFKARVVAQDVHVKPCALLDHGLSNPTGPDDSDRFPGNLIAKKWQVGMPETPFVLASQMFGAPQTARQVAHHEKREFSCRFRQNIGRVGKWDSESIRICSVDVVETNRKLRNNAERVFTRF